MTRLLATQKSQHIIGVVDQVVGGEVPAELLVAGLAVGGAPDHGGLETRRERHCFFNRYISYFVSVVTEIKRCTLFVLFFW